jgi:septum formation protein
MNSTRLILASASPRRLELLRSVGLDPEVRPIALDEAPLPGESPEAMVLRLARAKAAQAAEAVASRAKDAMTPAAAAVVLAADTTVAVEGRVLGKPADAAEAARMLRLLSGRAHAVVTGMALVLVDPLDGMRAAEEVCETRVVFAPLTDDQIASYVATGEPMDKAGAYGIQGGAGRFVVRVEGSYSNVVGLPLERLEPLLARLGLDLAGLRTS